MPTTTSSAATKSLSRVVVTALFLLAFLASRLPLGLAQVAPIRFAVIGDFGSAGSAELAVSVLVKGWNPDFVITTGDNNYPLGEASTIDVNIGQYYHDFIFPYFGSYGAGATVNRFFPSHGNHDWGDGYRFPADMNASLAYFTLPGNERYYDFVAGSVHLYAVDSVEYEPDGNTATSIQGQWLQNRLAAAAEPWKIVYFHYPPYSSADHGSIAFMQWPFQAWGASAVISGHSHVYERFDKNGLPYIVNGLGGAGRGGFTTVLPDSIVRYNADWGAQLVTAYPDTITFDFYTRTGLLVDTFSLLTTSVPPPAVPDMLAANAISSSQINLSWRDTADTETGFKIERRTGQTSFTQIATVGANTTAYSNTGLASATTYDYRVRAYNSGGNSDYSNTATATTGAAPPNAPTALVARSPSGGQIDLSWKDNSNNESGFRIERSPDGRTFTEIATVAADVKTYSDKGLPRDRFYYRVRAYNGAGNSAYSNVANDIVRRK